MEKSVGKITHYFSHIGVAVMDVTSELRAGDEIHILGHITDFTQKIISMEIEHRKVEVVSPGTEVALKVEEYVRKGDEVYKVSD